MSPSRLTLSLRLIRAKGIKSAELPTWIRPPAMHEGTSAKKTGEVSTSAGMLGPFLNATSLDRTGCPTFWISVALKCPRALGAWKYLPVKREVGLLKRARFVVAAPAEHTRVAESSC